jgi:hypothetical protein
MHISIGAGIVVTFMAVLEQATDALAQRLARSPDFFRAVVQPDSGAFFEQHGLLFDTLADVKKSIGGLSKA